MGAFQLALCLGLCCLVAGRYHTQTLRVDNGGRWGEWAQQDFCPLNKWAIGYQMKIEENQPGDIDDSALNGIRLICGANGMADGSQAVSQAGPWGGWGGEVRCLDGEVITGFRLQVQPDQGEFGDDTAANFMQARCRKLDTFREGDPVFPGKGTGNWGTYGGWSESCAKGTGVCGIRTKVERPQGYDKDDSALNDVELYCCGPSEE